MVRWPGKIPAGSVQRDRPPHGLAADLPRRRRRADVKEKLKKGITSAAIGRDYKVHLDGYNILPCSPARPTRARARRSSTSPTTAT
jgi:hypothetical protein